jgi:hypothetical protein
LWGIRPGLIATFRCDAPRVAARSSMSGASWWARAAAKRSASPPGQCGSADCHESGRARTGNMLFTPAAHRSLPLLCAHALPRSSMSGASLPAMEAAACGRETPLSAVMPPARAGALADERPSFRTVRSVSEDGGGCARQECRRPSLGRVAANGSKFAPSGPVRDGWSGGRTVNAPSHGALIATFRCDAPARCGAFADARRWPRQLPCSVSLW